MFDAPGAQNARRGSIYEALGPQIATRGYIFEAPGPQNARRALCLRPRGPTLQGGVACWTPRGPKMQGGLHFGGPEGPQSRAECFQTFESRSLPKKTLYRIRPGPAGTRGPGHPGVNGFFHNILRPKVCKHSAPNWGSEQATLLAFWGPGGSKMQPLLAF